MTEAPQFRSVRIGRYIFEFPLTKPRGHPLDPTDVVINDLGEVIIPIWRQQASGEDGTVVFRLCHMTVPTLAAAIRQSDHVIDRCSQEVKGLTATAIRLGSAISLYLTWNHAVFLNESHSHVQELLELASWLEHARRPEKQRAFGQLVTVIKKRGRDSRGRYNPQVMASHLFSVIYQLNQVREPNLERIVVEVAGRKAVLEFTRTVNQEILNSVVSQLQALLCHSLFSDDARPAMIWYHREINQIRKIAIDTLDLWGAPYLQVGCDFRTQLGGVIELLEARFQLKAAKKIRQLIAQIGQCESSLKAFKRMAVALRRSVNWRQRDFAICAPKLDQFPQRLNDLPQVLDPITRVLRITFMQLEGLLKRNTPESWDKATEELDRLIARCAW